MGSFEPQACGNWTGLDIAPARQVSDSHQFSAHCVCLRVGGILWLSTHDARLALYRLPADAIEDLFKEVMKA